MFSPQMQAIEQELFFFRLEHKKLSEKGFDSLAQKNAEHLNRLIKAINDMEKQAKKAITRQAKKALIVDFLDIEEFFRNVPAWYLNLFPIRHKNDLLLVDHNYLRYETLIYDFIHEVHCFRCIIEGKQDPTRKPIYETMETQFFDLLNPLWKADLVLFKSLTDEEIQNHWQQNELPLLNDHRL